MKNLLFMQENEFAGATSMFPSTMQPLYTHVNKLVTSNFQICFPAPYLSLHAKYSRMPNMPRGRTSPGLPYWSEGRFSYIFYNKLLTWRQYCLHSYCIFYLVTG